VVLIADDLAKFSDERVFPPEGQESVRKRGSGASVDLAKKGDDRIRSWLSVSVAMLLVCREGLLNLKDQERGNEVRVVGGGAFIRTPFR
jgi:hypothetical protein